MRRIAFIITLFLSAAAYLPAQEKYAVGFYNLENLFDTEDDPRINDADFTPKGNYQWTPKKYNQKLNKMASVIARLGKEQCPEGLAVLGVSEVENRRVLEDLVANKRLAGHRLGIVHHDSPDRRGIDVALLYNPALFSVESYKAYPMVAKNDTSFRTRDQLLVSGQLKGERMHFIINHWPSRRGGRGGNMRCQAAIVTRHIVDSLLTAEPTAKIVILGDFNDNPDDESTRYVLRASEKMEQAQESGLYNVTWNFWTKGIGTICYQNQWSLFDQVIISRGLLGRQAGDLRYESMEIFNRDFLIQKEGKYKGYPFRTFSGNRFQNGYSDHFPVVLYLQK